VELNTTKRTFFKILHVARTGGDGRKGKSDPSVKEFCLYSVEEAAATTT
jgi:hypothetical protein